MGWIATKELHQIVKLLFHRYQLDNMRLSIFTLGTAILLLTSCSAWTKHTKSGDAMKELTQKALFHYLLIPDPYFTEWAGKGPFKIDQMLRTRDSLIVNGKLYFDTPMQSENLKRPLPARSYRLTIPDSLANQYALTSDTADYEHDYALIYQFSPLLPTKDSEIYFMEYHRWFNLCDGDGCVRMLLRGYLRFRVKGTDIALIDTYGNENDDRFWGFGGFQRIKMEEALPGERIKQFGW